MGYPTVAWSDHPTRHDASRSAERVSTVSFARDHMATRHNRWRERYGVADWREHRAPRHPARMFRNFVPSAHDVRSLVRLAVPIAALQVGMMAMNVVDTVFVGHVSARELAAAALGGLYTIGLFN